MCEILMISFIIEGTRGVVTQSRTEPEVSLHLVQEVTSQKSLWAVKVPSHQGYLEVEGTTGLVFEFL